MAKKVESIKHKADKRAHIPSKEEAGYEDANAKVQDGKKVLELPKNPVVHRGQDPELFWLNKYGNDDRDDLLRVDIRSLYRHEHIAPETLIKNLYNVTETKSDQMDLFSVNELFGNALEKDEIDKVSEYYHHQDGWTNRLIQGDSHLVMASLLEREGMAGQVQTIYFDPPYGIKYGSNWQIKLNNRDVKDGNDEALSGEPEMIKAFRDTWELGIHSYLGYLRDRLLIAKELLTESGSCFVQISDENVHLVRSLMDEVFGSENFVSMISFKTKKMALGQSFLGSVNDYIIWFAKKIDSIKYRQLFINRDLNADNSQYNFIELIDGSYRRMTKEEQDDFSLLPKGAKIFRTLDLHSSGRTESCVFDFELNGQKCSPARGRSWKTNKNGIQTLIKKNRLVKVANNPEYKLFFDDYPVQSLMNIWDDTQGASEKLYVVQTTEKAIQRCLLMTTDPGDLVLDPTCGSGTTAFVAEQWGRRWITIDTSRIALNIAKQRLMTAVFPYYNLYDEQGSDIRQGFKYKTVPHITLKSLANDEPPATETLYDQPEQDKKLLRVSGPFTVETLQNFEPISPEDLDDEVRVNEEEGAFEEVIKQHLISAGIKNGRKDEMVVFRSVELLSHSYLHAEGFYMNGVGEKKAYFHIGPKFGTVSKIAVNEAVKECRQRGDAGWLIILGFSFESDIEGSTQTMSMGKFEVTKVRIHDDLLQEGLKKKPAKSAASFVTIGEPDIDLNIKGKEATIEIKGLDIYDPIKDEVKPRNVHDIAYWMVDEDYDGSNFVVKQVFFCGGDKDEFSKWKKGLDNLAKDSTKKKVEKTLKIEIDDEAFDRLYGHISHPIEIKKKGQKIAVRIISQFGEECTKVLVAD
jgi:adenine-specific DNA-methyltransferase